MTPSREDATGAPDAEGTDGTAATTPTGDADPLRAPPGERSLAERLRFGVVNLDKPAGPSAHQVSAWLREAVADVAPGVDRAAHAGTLDPKVTGCLPVLTGAATRLARVFDDAAKTYVTVLQLHGPAPTDLAAVLAEFEGPLVQRPPRHSAVRRELRVRRVHELTLLEHTARRCLLRIDCEAGTYVRKLCHHLGLALGTGAHMGALRRTRAGVFDDRDLVDMYDVIDALAFATGRDDGETPAGVTALDGVIEPAERALVGLPRVTIAPSAAREVAHGAPVYAPGVIEYAPAPRTVEREPSATPPEADTEPLVACHTPDGSAVCLGRLVGDPTADRGTVVSLERVLV